MKKKLLLVISGLLVVVSGIVALAAYEAHVINVTAHIENALKILPITKKLDFGTVFPQEYREIPIWITTSESFCATEQRRVTSIDYKIVQKPKPIWPVVVDCTALYPDATIDEARAYCHANSENLDCCYPSLCPYLSKTPKIADPDPWTDYGVLAFHDPSNPSSIARGIIDKDRDLQDEWTIDLAVPCFVGMCSQDWPAFVARYNPTANPREYELPMELETEIFGCDLWVEVTNIY